MSKRLNGEATDLQSRDFPKVTEKSKKRLFSGRKADKNKKERLSGHESGADCKCVRLKCFENVAEADRKALLDAFNAMESKEKQDCYLTSLITVQNVQKWRPRKKENDAKFHEYSYSYKLIVQDDGKVKYIEVCLKAFCAIFGIGVKRVRRIRKSIADTGLPPKDMQGRQWDRPHAHSP